MGLHEPTGREVTRPACTGSGGRCGCGIVWAALAFTQRFSRVRLCFGKCEIRVRLTLGPSELMHQNKYAFSKCLL